MHACRRASRPVQTDNTQRSRTLCGLASWTEQAGQNPSMQNGSKPSSGSALAILPTIVLVIALQRYLVKGLAFSAFGGR